MPELIRMYIRHVAIGFALSAVFVGLILWGNVLNLQHLVMNTSGGYLAAFLLWFFNGLVFAGAQFGIAVMGMAEEQDPEDGTTAPEAIHHAEPLPIRIEAPRTPIRATDPGR